MSTTTADQKDEKSETPNDDKLANMTPYELEVNRLKLSLRMGWINQAKYDEDLAKLDATEKERELTPEEKAKKDEEKAAKEKANADAKATADAEAKKKADEEAAAKEREKQNELSAQKLAGQVDDGAVQRAAELAAKKIAEQMAPKPQVDDFESKLPRAYQRDLAVAKFMAENDPRHKNLATQFIDFYKAEPAYIAEWERNNPGKRFNPDDEEHEAFYERHEPKVDPDEFADAKDQMIRKSVTEEITQKVTQEVTERVSKEFKPKVEEVEFKENLRTKAPEISKRADTGMISMLGQIEDATVKESLVVDGQVVVNEETDKRLTEANPDKREIIDEEASLLRGLLHELHSMDELGDRYKADPRAVRLIGDVAFRVEKEMAGKTASDGRKIITQDEWDARLRQIAQMPKTEQQAAVREFVEKHCQLPAAAVEEALIKESTQRTNARLTHLNKLIERYSGAKGGNGTQSPPKKEGTPPPAENRPGTTPEPRRQKPPATTSSTDKVGDGKGGGVKGGLTEESVANKLWPRP